MSLRIRSLEPEILDTEDVGPAALARVLADLAAVNTVTLARPPTVAWLRRAARTLPPGAALSVLDVGFGEGDMLRRIHRWAARRGLRTRLTGIDLNPGSAVAASAQTPAAWGIDYRTGDIFGVGAEKRFDVVISSLVTHHLTDDQVVAFLRWMERVAVRGWFINDLHRHQVALEGFRALSWVARWDPIVRQDGALSVARAFRLREWRVLLRRAGIVGAKLRWHVPFRLCVGRLR